MAESDTIIGIYGKGAGDNSPAPFCTLKRDVDLFEALQQLLIILEACNVSLSSQSRKNSVRLKLVPKFSAF